MDERRDCSHRDWAKFLKPDMLRGSRARHGVETSAL